MLLGVSIGCANGSSKNVASDLIVLLVRYNFKGFFIFIVN